MACLHPQADYILLLGTLEESAETFLCERKSISADPQQGEKPCSTWFCPQFRLPQSKCCLTGICLWFLILQVRRVMSIRTTPVFQMSEGEVTTTGFSLLCCSWSSPVREMVLPLPSLWLTGFPLVAPHPKLWGKWHLTGLTQHSSYSRAMEAMQDCILLSLLSHQRWGGNNEIPTLLVPSAPELMPDWILL